MLTDQQRLVLKDLVERNPKKLARILERYASESLPVVRCIQEAYQHTNSGEDYTNLAIAMESL